MKRIKEFFKNNYIMVTIIGAVIFVALASLIIIGLINKYRKKIEVSNETTQLYQVDSIARYDFSANVVLHNNVIKTITPDDYTLSNWDPIYYSDGSWLLNSNDAMLISYKQNFTTYKIPKYTKLAKESNSFKVNINGSNYITNNYFVFDPVGHYYLIFDDVKLKYNGKIIELSPMSYVTASIAGIFYYNFATGEKINFNNNINNASLIYDDFSINLLNNYIDNGKDSFNINVNMDFLKVFKED